MGAGQRDHPQPEQEDGAERRSGAEIVPPHLAKIDGGFVPVRSDEDGQPGALDVLPDVVGRRLPGGNAPKAALPRRRLLDRDIFLAVDRAGTADEIFA